MTARRFVTICAGWCLVASAASQSTVHLRGGGTIDAAELSVSPAGVGLVLDGAKRTLPWHRVRWIEGDAADAWTEYRDVADDAWRGLSRLERGDPYAAELPLARAFERLRDSRSETTALVAEGLLDCRLQLGSPAEAIEPWLVALACYAEGAWAGPGPTSPIDAETLLVPSLMPALLHGDLGRAGVETPTTGSGRVGTIGTIMAVAFDDASAVDMRLSEDADPGLRLLAAVVGTTLRDETTRGIARRTLIDLSSRLEERWMRAWCDAGIGVSLLQDGAGSQEAAIGYLLRVAVQVGDTYPDLGALALGRAVEGLLDRGRLDEARRLAGELRSADPANAVLRRARIRSLLQDPAPLPVREGESSL